MTGQTTIKDIANALGMHHTTVSRALRNHPDVKEETRDLVMQKAKELNYVPNSFATNLRSQKSSTIGLLVPDITAGFFAKTTGIFTNLAYQAGYSVMICQSNEDVEWEKKNVEMLLQNRVAGVIATLCREETDLNHMKMLEQSSTPLVYFDRVPQNSSINKVIINNASAAFQATEKLIESGRKNIAFYVGRNEIKVFKDRQLGYENAMKKHGLNINKKMIVEGGLKMKDGYRLAKNIEKVSRKPDAVICGVDQVAIGLLRGLAEQNVKVPEQIAVMGFDNDPGSEIILPALSTFEPPVEELCHAAFELLMQSINSDEEDKPVVKSFKMKYIERKST